MNMNMRTNPNTGKGPCLCFFTTTEDNKVEGIGMQLRAANGCKSGGIYCWMDNNCKGCAIDFDNSQYFCLGFNDVCQMMQVLIGTRNVAVIEKYLPDGKDTITITRTDDGCVCMELVSTCRGTAMIVYRKYKFTQANVIGLKVALRSALKEIAFGEEAMPIDR